MDESQIEPTSAENLRHGLAQLTDLIESDRIMTRDAEPWLVAVEVACMSLRREIHHQEVGQ